MGISMYGDLFGPQPIRLDVDLEPASLLDQGEDPVAVARQFPDSSLVWAFLAENAVADHNFVAAYAYARTGYHRGIDQLRKAGWKGFGPVPYAHSGNQGWLRSVAALSHAAHAIGEESEYLRCLDLIHESDPSPQVAQDLGVQ